MKNTTKVKLSAMMFLEFFIWGGWFVSLGTFLGETLGANGAELDKAYSTQSWGAIVAPFIIGLIADRYFNAERILGVLHIAGAVLMYLMSQADSFSVFYPYVFIYMILYMPTLALVNSVAFNQMKDPAKEFSVIRVFGTIGWIVAGLTISFIFHWDSVESVKDGLLKNTFLMVSITSLALGVLSFTLPKTPPKSSGSIKISDILGLDALSLLKDRNFLIFFISSILICIPLAFYYQYTHLYLSSIHMENVTGMMSIGQMSEALCLLLLPFFFKKYGFKNTLLVGMLAWTIRYVLFAYGGIQNMGGLTMLIMGIALHGICYDFFFVSGQIYTNSKAGEGTKSAAQGMITLATYGLGMLIGFFIAGKIADSYKNGDVYEWASIWIFPALFAMIVLVIFGVFFKKETIIYSEK